jgi:hypothetical protein
VQVFAQRCTNCHGADERSLKVHNRGKVDDFRRDNRRRWHFNRLDLDGRAIGHLEYEAADSHPDCKFSTFVRQHLSEPVKLSKHEIS